MKIKQNYMGYSLEVAFYLWRESYEYQDMEDSGFVWVGDQLILGDSIGAYDEVAYVTGETIKRNVICIKPVNKGFANVTNTFVEFEDDREIEFKENIELIELLNKLVLDSLCKIIACDSSTENDVASNYIKIANKAGLKVGLTVIPYHSEMVCMYHRFKSLKSFDVNGKNNYIFI